LKKIITPEMRAINPWIRILPVPGSKYAKVLNDINKRMKVIEIFFIK